MNAIQIELENCIKKEIQRSAISYADGMLLHTLRSRLESKNYDLNSSAIQYVMRKYKIMKRIQVKPLNQEIRQNKVILQIHN